MYETRYVCTDCAFTFFDRSIKPDLKEIGYEIRPPCSSRGDFILAAYVPLVMVTAEFFYDSECKVGEVELIVKHPIPNFRAPDIEAIVRKYGFECARASTIQERIEERINRSRARENSK